MSSPLFLPKTKYLLEFLNIHISHKLQCFQKTKFSSQSKRILSLLFEKMIEAEALFAQSKSKFVKKSLKTIPMGKDFELIDDEVKRHIKSMQANLLGFSYSFMIHSRKVNVFLVSEKLEEFSFENAIKKIYTWLYVAMPFSKSECSQELDIYFYLTDLEKKVPKHNAIIDRINANTGFTFTCKPINEINIYRVEEWFKVFVHESFHNLGLDFSHHECSRIDKKIAGIFPVSLDVRIYETYCEMWAEIINVMFVVMRTSTSVSHSTSNLLKKLEKFMDYERTFSLFQCAKILKHFGITYKQLYEQTDSSHMARKMRYKEKTPVLSYYIIKSFLMYKLNHFLEWCVSHNGLSVRFNDDDINKTLDDYFLLVQENYTDKKYIACIESLCDWFTKQEKTRRKEDTEFSTLRMSLFELA
jgi:hypothetical protein